MLYKNTKTGVVISVRSPISGENWEPLKEPAKPKKEKAVKNGGKRK